MNETDLAMVQDWVRQWGYLGIVILMTLESAPLVGLMLPGIFITLSLGALTASGVLPFVETWLFAALGAMLDDSLGYWLGLLGSKEWNHHLHKTRFLQKRSKASSYLDRYGALGIAIGWYFDIPAALLFLRAAGLPGFGLSEVWR